jgi:predicted nucleic-acid-binding Zn-ribbon protein
MEKSKTGAHGWPLVPSVRFPGEQALSCPKCGGTTITLFSVGAGIGSGPGGSHRFGDNYRSAIRCESCKHQEISTEVSMHSR